MSHVSIRLRSRANQEVSRSNGTASVRESVPSSEPCGHSENSFLRFSLEIQRRIVLQPGTPQQDNIV